MRKSRRPLVIASRQSRLAKAQAEMIGAALARANPGLVVHYQWIESEGDRRVDEPLADVGGKGLFARAVEKQLLDGAADLAVHSLKDLPPRGTPGLQIAAVPLRADARDCLVSRTDAPGVADLPRGAVVGTAAPRRAAQLLRLRPDLTITLIRGNVETRLAKVLDRQPAGATHYDATLLAMAGLERVGLLRHGRYPIPVDTILPAACQGALALQCRVGDHVTLLRCLPLNHPASAQAVHAERAVVAGLHGDCDSPIAAYATNEDDSTLRLRVRVLSPDGRSTIEHEDRERANRLGKLVKRVLEALDAKHARKVMRGL